MDNVSIYELNSEEAKQYLGGVVFIAVLMTAGVIGNSHVIFVYSLRMKPSNHRVFILVLAVLDVISCCIGMPFILVTLRNPLTFTMTSVCKLFRFTIDYVTAASIFVLLSIAIERYRKICVPLGRQISQRAAKIACAAMMVVALLLSWPALVLYGGSTVRIANTNNTGTRCSTDDKFKDTKFQALLNVVFIVIVFGVFATLVVLYSLIGRAIKRHSNFNVTPKTSTTTEPSKSVVSEKPRISSTSTNDANSIEPATALTVRQEGTQAGTSKDPVPSTSKMTKQSNEQRKFSKVQRITSMLFMITVVFFVSYIPNLLLKIVLYSNPDLLSNMSFTGRVFFNMFIWCFFVNNVTNPVIYGFCDVRFKRELFRIYNTLWRL